MRTTWLAIYTLHYIQQSCGLVKIAEYEDRSDEAVRERIARIQAEHPGDKCLFVSRRVWHTATIN